MLPKYWPFSSTEEMEREAILLTFDWMNEFSEICCTVHDTPSSTGKVLVINGRSFSPSLSLRVLISTSW